MAQERPGLLRRIWCLHAWHRTAACVLVLAPAGSQDLDVVLLRSTDGKSFEAAGTLAERAGSASLCWALDGRLAAAFQWFPEARPESFDQVAVSFSADEGATWSEPLSIVIDSLPEGMARPSEPCLVALEDGRMRLYFSAHSSESPWPATHSAVSDDGRLWTFEPGVRVGVEGSHVLDPAVARFQGQWHFLAPVEGRDGVAYHALSADGLAFRRLPEIDLEGAGRWLGSALADGDSLRFFGSGRVGWSASSPDGMHWRLEPRVSWSAAADPGVVRLKDGRLLIAGSAPGVRPSDAEQALEAAQAGSAGALAANDRFVYVLRGDTLYMYEANTLRFVRAIRLPAPGTGPGAGRSR